MRKINHSLPLPQVHMVTVSRTLPSRLCMAMSILYSLESSTLLALAVHPRDLFLVNDVLSVLSTPALPWRLCSVFSAIVSWTVNPFWFQPHNYGLVTQVLGNTGHFPHDSSWTVTSRTIACLHLVFYTVALIHPGWSAVFWTAAVLIVPSRSMTLAGCALALDI